MFFGKSRQFQRYSGNFESFQDSSRMDPEAAHEISDGFRNNSNKLLTFWQSPKPHETSYDASLTLYDIIWNLLKQSETPWPTGMKHSEIFWNFMKLTKTIWHFMWCRSGIVWNILKLIEPIWNIEWCKSETVRNIMNLSDNHPISLAIHMMQVWHLLVQSETVSGAGIKNMKPTETVWNSVWCKYKTS